MSRHPSWDPFWLLCRLAEAGWCTLGELRTTVTLPQAVRALEVLDGLEELREQAQKR